MLFSYRMVRHLGEAARGRQTGMGNLFMARHVAEALHRKSLKEHHNATKRDMNDRQRQRVNEDEARARGL